MTLVTQFLQFHPEEENRNLFNVTLASEDDHIIFGAHLSLGW